MPFVPLMTKVPQVKRTMPPMSITRTTTTGQILRPVNSTPKRAGTPKSKEHVQAKPLRL